MVKSIIKQIGREIAKGFVFLLKLAILTIFLLWFTYDSVIVSPMQNIYVLIFYESLMLINIIALAVTLFKKNNRKVYLVFVLSLAAYILSYFYLIPVVEQHGADRCLDSGRGVWDYNRHECRQDCLTWNKDVGCVPITEENINEKSKGLL